MGYVVKAMCYLDKNGYGVPTSSAAQEYDDYELANIAAETAGGFVVYVENGQIISETVKSKSKMKKETKANQAWMTKK